MIGEIALLRPLGAGGNGDCHLAVHRASGTQVVVKFLREFQLPDSRRRFKREVKVLAHRLRGLVPVIHADLDGERPYYVMPYLPGGAVAKHAGHLSDSQLRNIATEVASTLAELHGRMVAHGDVKPDNILVGNDGHLQVADPLGNGMGCTVIFSENRGGTPGYWAPEILAGAEISQAGDVYSFGATLYHLATARIPRDGERLDIPESENVGSMIRHLVSICCVAAPTERPTMADVLRILKGESWTQIRETRRNWKILGGAALAVLGLAALFGRD
jgi:serine/threonine protein kinase